MKCREKGFQVGDIYARPGDGIGLIAPAGHILQKEIQPGIELLEAQGYLVKRADNLFGKHRYFSGTITQRVSDIHDFLDDPDIKVLYAVRGGSGSSQLLPHLDYAKWRISGKPLIGFSDISALQWAIWHNSAIKSVSGMALTFQLRTSNPYISLFLRQLRGTRKSITARDLQKEKLVVAREGEARGILLGGTLSIIVSLLGTPYFPENDENIILFIEEVNEPLYRMERAIVQLKLSGFVDRVRGLILGRFKL
ncbi:MAG: LD-carboxypeptidase, partial [Calditrichaeota bacterium]